MTGCHVVEQWPFQLVLRHDPHCGSLTLLVSKISCTNIPSCQLQCCDFTQIRVCFLNQDKKNITLLSWLYGVEEMVHGKKLAEEMLLPSVLEDGDAETESEKLQLGKVGSQPSSQL